MIGALGSSHEAVVPAKDPRSMNGRPLTPNARVRQLRVAFVTGRPAYYRLPIFQRLSDSHRVEFLFTGTGGDRYWLNDHPEDTEGLVTFDASNPMRLFRRLTTGGYDAIVLSLAGRSHLLAAAAARRLTGCPLVLWVGIWQYPHSVAHSLGRPLVRGLLNSADAIVAYGPHAARWIEQEVGRTRNVVLFWNAIDNEHFERVDPKRVNQLRASLPLRNKVLACFVGRLAPEKGLPILLHALAQSDGDLGLVLIGTGNDSGAVGELAAHYGVSDRVALVGYVAQQELPNYYALCDFLVLPSVGTRMVRETWGLVSNEAMNAGLPVVATDAVGAAAGGLILDEKTGLVVPQKDTAALANALMRMTTNPSLRHALGATARCHVKKWNFDAAAASFEEALHLARGERA